MKKRLNLKFLACMFLGVVTFAAGVHFLHAFQIRRNAGAFLALSEEAEKKKDMPKAVDYLGRYLALVPEDKDARAQFALLLADKTVATSPKALLRAYFTLGKVLLR